MEPFEKVEFILKAMIADKGKAIERTKKAIVLPRSEVYVQGLGDQIQGLQQAYALVLDVKNGGKAVSDETIEKIWLPKLKVN